MSTLAVERATRAALKVKARQIGYDRYINDPVGFCSNVLGEHLWSKQREVAESVRDNRHTLVPSSHDTGKSFIASRIAAWWLSVHAPGEAFVVTSAPSFAQVRAILWREINRAHKKGNLPGRTNQTEWHIDGEIVAYGRKPADYDEDAFQGIHSRYVLVILDEACGIPASLWTAAETITTNENCRVLAIGNPDTPLSEFKRKTESPIWHTIHIDGLGSPNFTGEVIHEDPRQDAIIKESLLSRTWVDERRQEWGEDSPLWLSKVRGRFPLVPEGQVYKELSPSQQWYGPLPAFSRLVGGLDFGGANDDAHMTAGVVAGVVAKVEHGEQIAPAGALIRFAHFEDAGPSVHGDLLNWMRSVETKMGRRVEWRADKTQSFGIAQAKEQGFIIEPTHGGADSVWIGISMVRRRMADGASFFTEPLTRTPVHADGRVMKGKAWFTRMQNYRWQLQPQEDRAVPGVPIKRDDDTCIAGETPILMADGTEKRMDLIREGDMVMTLDGPAPVIDMWATGIKPTVRIGDLRCTPDHHVVYTDAHGYLSDVEWAQVQAVSGLQASESPRLLAATYTRGGEVSPPRSLGTRAWSAARWLVGASQRREPAEQRNWELAGPLRASRPYAQARSLNAPGTERFGKGASRSVAQVLRGESVASRARAADLDWPGRHTHDLSPVRGILHDEARLGESLQVVLRTMQSCEPAPETIVYDLMVDAPSHTFIAGGFVVSNCDADRYLEEAADGFPVDNSPAIAPRTLSGRPRATKAA